MASSSALSNLPTTAAVNHNPPREPFETWPMSCRNFNAAIDDADEICSHFCPNPKCDNCDPEEALHVSTYTAAGDVLFDGKVNGNDLRAHLESDVGPLGSCDPMSATAPRYMLYFVSDRHTEDCVTTPYMRQIFAHYHAPTDVARTFASNSLSPGFQSYTELVNQGTNVPPSRVLHCWVKPVVQLTKDDLSADLEFFSQRNRNRQEAMARRCSTAIEDVALYMTYDYSTRRCAVVCTEYCKLFRALQQTCHDAGKMFLNENPFVFFAVFFKCILNATRRTAIHWRHHIHAYSEILMAAAVKKEHLTALLGKCTNERIAYSRTADAVQGIILDIDSIIKQHRQWAKEQALSLDQEEVQWVEQSLEEQRALASQSAMLFRDCAETVEMFSQVILGYSQLNNSYATEALAVEAKRDTKTMKMITYVTLVFLPSTFVSTVFSMGLFNFDSDMATDGHITISRHGWIYLAVALPLTFVTLALAYLWMRVRGDGGRAGAADIEARKLITSRTAVHNELRRMGLNGTPEYSSPSDISQEKAMAIRSVMSRGLQPGELHKALEPLGVRLVRGTIGEHVEEVPIEEAPREDLARLTAELEQLVNAKISDGTTRRRPWYRRLIREDVTPASAQTNHHASPAVVIAARTGAGQGGIIRETEKVATPTSPGAFGTRSDRLHFNSRQAPVQATLAGRSSGASTAAAAAAAGSRARRPPADRLHFVW